MTVNGTMDYFQLMEGKCLSRRMKIKLKAKCLSWKSI